MTLNDIATMVGTIDNAARHYFSMSTAENYTYWEEIQQLPFTSDDRHEEAWHFYIHRFTKNETDSIAALLMSTLDADPRTTVIHTVDHDKETGYIHHIFECEGY